MKPKPCIGVILVPDTVTGRPFFDPDIQKWIESAGVSTVPISPYCQPAECAMFFETIDGMFLHPGKPGGFHGSGMRQHLLVCCAFLTMAEHANLSGERRFPVWGTCLGFQQILSHVGGFHLNSLDYITPHSQSHSYFNHKRGLTLSRFKKNRNLVAMFHVVATARDKQTGVAYVAMIRGKTLPFVGVQFHPEKDASTAKLLRDLYVNDIART